MQGKVTLKNIIESVLSDIDTDSFTAQEIDQYEDDKEKNTRKLYRKFERLLERLGTDKEILKAGGRTMSFNESEVPFMKVLLTQLLVNKGIIAEFTNDAGASKKFSSRDIHDLIQSLIDEADKSGMDEDELKQMAGFLYSIFLASPLRSIEKCHSLIDTLASCLQDLTSDQQARYLKEIEKCLERECFLRSIESIIEISNIAEIVEASTDGSDTAPYSDYPPEIGFEYLQRDRNVLRRIQEDDDLRKYIETVFRKSAEEIFYYVTLE